MVLLKGGDEVVRQFRKRTDGGITLEAAIVLPVIIALLLLFLSFAQSIAVQLALRHAAAETVKEIAANAYVLTFIQEPSFLTRLEELAASLPAPLQEIVRAQGRQLTEEVWKAALLPLVRSHIERTLLDPSRLAVHSVAIPDWQGTGSRMFGVHLVYTHRLHVPFFSRDVDLHAHAYERLWTGEGG